MGGDPDLLGRTKAMALRVVRLTDSLPGTRAADVMGRQLLRSATSVAANYRAAKRGRSVAEFMAKLGIVEEEADETLFWLEMLVESRAIKPEMVADLIRETGEILSMVVASIKTARLRKPTPTPKPGTRSAEPGTFKTNGGTDAPDN